VRLSELLGKPVIDESGRRIGVIHDVAATQDGPIVGAFGAALRIDALIVGTTGLWDRIGFSSAHISGPGLLRGLSRFAARTDEVAWDRVLRITDDVVVVIAP
jgi:sporulation protein YlmC with PRC-barrel domain